MLRKTKGGSAPPGPHQRRQPRPARYPPYVVARGATPLATGQPPAGERKLHTRESRCFDQHPGGRLPPAPRPSPGGCCRCLPVRVWGNPAATTPTPTPAQRPPLNRFHPLSRAYRFRTLNPDRRFLVRPAIGPCGVDFPTLLHRSASASPPPSACSCSSSCSPAPCASLGIRGTGPSPSRAHEPQSPDPPPPMSALTCRAIDPPREPRISAAAQGEQQWGAATPHGPRAAPAGRPGGPSPERGGWVAALRLPTPRRSLSGVAGQVPAATVPLVPLRSPTPGNGGNTL